LTSPHHYPRYLTTHALPIAFTSNGSQTRFHRWQGSCLDCFRRGCPQMLPTRLPRLPPTIQHSTIPNNPLSTASNAHTKPTEGAKAAKKTSSKLFAPCKHTMSKSPATLLFTAERPRSVLAASLPRNPSLLTSDGSRTRFHHWQGSCLQPACLIASPRDKGAISTASDTSPPTAFKVVRGATTTIVVRYVPATSRRHYLQQANR